MKNLLGRVWDWIYYHKDCAPSELTLRSGTIQPRIHLTVLTSLLAMFLFGCSSGLDSPLAALTFWLVIFQGMGEAYNVQVRVFLPLITWTRNQIRLIDIAFAATPNQPNAEQQRQNRKSLVEDLRGYNSIVMSFATLFLARMAVITPILLTSQGYVYAHKLIVPILVIVKYGLLFLLACIQLILT